MTAARAFMCALALALAMPSTAGERVAIRLSPTISAFAPANLHVWVMVAAHPDNRALKVVAESPAFYRSSEITIEGEEAPQTNAFEFRNLPSGTYLVSAVLVDRTGHEFKVNREFEVMGGEH